MKKTIPRNILISVGVLFAAGRLLAGGMPQPSIITFDPPGAGTGPGQGTTPFCNNPAGAITGYYFDSSNVIHGFLRTP